MSRLITSISGVRGIPGDSLLPGDIVRYAEAFAGFCGAGKIVVGFDGRPSGTAVKRLVLGTLQLCGADVVDLGMVPTPTVQMAVTDHSARGGISITASHNPSQWNGLKFLDESGVFLNAEQNAALFRLADNGGTTPASWNKIGTCFDDPGAIQRHIDAILGSPILDADRIRRKGFVIVVDAVNASGSFIIPQLLSSLGCVVHPIACDGSGVFPHLPEPLPENLRELGTAVLARNADLGLAVDPDADRLVLFTEKGDPFGEEYTIASAVDSFLSRYTGESKATVVVNLSTTAAVDAVALKYGALVERSPVGEINVVEKMRHMRSPIGGEGSGGVIVPAIHAGRDSLVATALVLDVLARFDGPASAYRASLPDFWMFKSKWTMDSSDAIAAIHNVMEAFAGRPMNSDDGIRIEFEEGWVHLRASNTEPIVRVISESKTRDQAQALAEAVRRIAFGSVAEAV